MYLKRNYSNKIGVYGEKNTNTAYDEFLRIFKRIYDFKKLPSKKI